MSALLARRYPADGYSDVVVAGFGPDIAKALEDVCDIDVTVIQAWWNDCWDYGGLIGDSLKTGDYHGCMTYTHTVGVRNRYMDFSAPILDQNKYAGFLTRLDSSGSPLVSPKSDLSDVTVVYISGWAPTAFSPIGGAQGYRDCLVVRTFACVCV